MATIPQSPEVNRNLLRIKWLKARLLIKTCWQEEAILRMELIDLHKALQYHVNGILNVIPSDIKSN